MREREAIPLLPNMPGEFLRGSGSSYRPAMKTLAAESTDIRCAPPFWRKWSGTDDRQIRAASQKNLTGVNVYTGLFYTYFQKPISKICPVSAGGCRKGRLQSREESSLYRKKRCFL